MPTVEPNTAPSEDPLNDTSKEALTEAFGRAMSRIESLLEQNKALNREMLERQEEAWQREYKLLTSMEALQLHVTQLEKENAQLKANQSVVVADSLPQPASPSQPRSVGPPSLVPESVTDELQQIKDDFETRKRAGAKAIEELLQREPDSDTPEQPLASSDLSRLASNLASVAAKVSTVKGMTQATADGSASSAVPAVVRTDGGSRGRSESDVFFTV